MNLSIRKNMQRGILVFVCLLYFVGCGQGERGSTTEEQETIMNAQIVTAEADSLYINECIPLEFTSPDIEYHEKSLFYDTYGSKLYVLWAYTGEGNNTEHLSLFLFDGETKEMEQYPFALQIPERAESHIQSMDVRDGGQISLRMGDIGGDFLVITDMEGNILSQQEPFPDQEEYPWNTDMFHRYENRVFDNGDGTAILSQCREQENVTDLFLYDAENGEKTPLAVFDGELVRSLCMDGVDTMYYTTLESLSRWNRVDNTRTRLLDLHGNGFSASPVSTNLLTNSKGEVMVCELEGEIPCVFVLSGEMSQTEEEIRIAFLAGIGSDSLGRPARIFAQTHPEYGFVQEQGEDKTDRQILRDRVFVELSAGRGPELMWVSREDMYTLCEKGLLMDVSGLIPEDVWEQLLPCVVRSGTVNGSLTGIKLHSSYQTVFISDALWEEDSWTVSDALDILQSREDWGSTFSYSIWDMPTSYTPYELFSEVLMTDLEHSEFLDIEQGFCNFDSQEFIELLEVCKKYGQKDQPEQDMNEWHRQIKEGDSIAHVSILSDGLADFSSAMSMYEDNAHMIGFPTKDGSRNYVSANNSYLVVNANAKHLEEIKELIAYLLSYENQFEHSYDSVRRDVIEESVVYSEFWETLRLKLSVTGETSMELALKPDGTSWLEEYLTFIDTCEPASNWRNTPVGTILSEELQPYFAGDKSAKEVAGIIQSRVQIYLEESR